MASDAPAQPSVDALLSAPVQPKKYDPLADLDFSAPAGDAMPAIGSAQPAAAGSDNFDSLFGGNAPANNNITA